MYDDRLRRDMIIEGHGVIPAPQRLSSAAADMETTSFHPDVTQGGHIARTVRLRPLRKPVQPRKLRIDFVAEELQNLIAGVKRYGSRWTDILAMYNFHSSRSAVDLKEKWARVMKREERINSASRCSVSN